MGWRMWKISLPLGFDHRIFQPVPSRYTEYAKLALSGTKFNKNNHTFCWQLGVKCLITFYIFVCLVSFLGVMWKSKCQFVDVREDHFCLFYHTKRIDTWRGKCEVFECYASWRI
jgi:hypothetical protein